MRADLTPAGARACGAVHGDGARCSAVGALIGRKDGDLGHVEEVAVRVEYVQARVAPRERAVETHGPAGWVLLKCRWGKWCQRLRGWRHEASRAVRVVAVVFRVADVEVKVVEAGLAGVLAVVDLDHAHRRRAAKVYRDVVFHIAV